MILLDFAEFCKVVLELFVRFLELTPVLGVRGLLEIVNVCFFCRPVYQLYHLTF